MATSDSDDFESADEELVARGTPSRKVSSQWQRTNSAIDSESDDDNVCMPPVNNSGNRSVQTSGQERRSRSSVTSIESTPSSKSAANKSEVKITQKKTTQDKVSEPQKEPGKDLTEGKVSSEKVKNPSPSQTIKVEQEAPKTETSVEATPNTELPKTEDAARKLSSAKEEADAVFEEAQAAAKDEPQLSEEKSEAAPARKERAQRQRKPKEAKSLGAKKLGSKVATEGAARPPPADATTPDEIRRKAIAEGKEPPVIEECWEFNEEETVKILQGMKKIGLGNANKVKMPEELISDKKFSEIFKPVGCEDLNNEKILAELDDNAARSVLDKISSASEDQSGYAGWGSWGSWGMNSLINSATASVTTLAGHVTHGLTLLDEAVGAPNPEELAKTEKPDDAESIEDKSSSSQEIQSSFGFNDLISGVSSITRLVESTGTKVITGGLGTLETIGKKTMEVLQEGDPGLKKKRAFFMNEGDKPILSQMLREAKEKAEVEEKTLEEKQLLRKVHFESLFDDYQGLVHLEALEMLSKQCNMKIQQRLVTLDADELTSIQETLEEVKELCDLGDEDEEEDNENNLQERLQAASKDLGVAITYEKLHDIWKDTRSYLADVSSPDSIVAEREVFQRAISTLARFTAFSVERFHKTAELLLIKERRSTVNEADALVQLTRILSGQIGIAANAFSNWLNDRMKNSEKPDSKCDITTIFLEAANASSYIQDAFRLLIPILQVGAI